MEVEGNPLRQKSSVLHWDDHHEQSCSYLPRLSFCCHRRIPSQWKQWSGCWRWNVGAGWVVSGCHAGHCRWFIIYCYGGRICSRFERWFVRWLIGNGNCGRKCTSDGWWRGKCDTVLLLVGWEEIVFVGGKVFLLAGWEETFFVGGKVLLWVGWEETIFVGSKVLLVVFWEEIVFDGDAEFLWFGERKSPWLVILKMGFQLVLKWWWLWVIAGVGDFIGKTKKLI